VNVQELRDYPRVMLDLEVDDLPDVLLDRWMAEGFQRIIRRVQRWPHLETSETLVTEADVQAYSLPTIQKIRSMHGPRGELLWMDESEARQAFWNVTTAFPSSYPKVWSEWGDGVVLWPTPDDAYTVSVTGYRAPLTTWIGVAGEDPDLPERYHEILLSWVMFRTYQQQDDIENAQIERGQFDDGLAELTADDMSLPPSTAGLVLGGQRNRGVSLNSRLPFEWE
jgi:hypothetical protein